MTIYTASQKAPKGVGGPGTDPTRPWVDPTIGAAAENAGVAGKITHAALDASRGSMGLGGKI